MFMLYLQIAMMTLSNADEFISFKARTIET